MTKKEQENLAIGIGFMGLVLSVVLAFRKKETIHILLPTQVKFES